MWLWHAHNGRDVAQEADNATGRVGGHDTGSVSVTEAGVVALWPPGHGPIDRQVLTPSSAAAGLGKSPLACAWLGAAGSVMPPCVSVAGFVQCPSNPRDATSPAIPPCVSVVGFVHWPNVDVSPCVFHNSKIFGPAASNEGDSIMHDAGPGPVWEKSTVAAHKPASLGQSIANHNIIKS